MARPADIEMGMMALFMDPAIYRAVTSGDKEYFEQQIECGEEQSKFIWEQETPRGNTILHIAASLRHDQLIVKLIQKSISECKKLFKIKNHTGDIPLHVAASAGHQSTVEILLTVCQKVVVAGDLDGDNPTECGDEEEPLRMKNDEENTPLHVALKNRCKEVARVLIHADREVSSYLTLNKEGKSPLYLAVEAGYVDLVQLMIKNSARSDNKEKPFVHAAIKNKNMDVLKAILNSNWRDDLLMAKDDEGFTPLSYAASTGYLDGVHFLLTEFPGSAYVSKNGTFPIHMASSKGHIKIIEKLLQYYPDSGELLTNPEKWNILHVAAMNGKARAVRHMLKIRGLEMLVNERDIDGNTPLHLASKGGHPKVVSILTWDKRVDLNLLNDEDQTALDIAVNYSGKMPSFRKRLTWLALRHAGASRAPRPPRPSTIRVKPRSSESNYKERVNTLLLVATLITTVTFAAGFTMPGSYSSSEKNLGMANFVKRRMFHAFLISNTMAMYSSIAVVVALIWAQLGDISLVLASLKLTVPLLGIALTMVSVAFMTGIYLVVSSLYWLANVVLIMGSIFLFILLVLFIPLYNPISLNHTITRYIFYYPFCLLVIVTRSDADNEGKS